MYNPLKMKDVVVNPSLLQLVIFLFFLFFMCVLRFPMEKVCDKLFQKKLLKHMCAFSDQWCSPVLLFPPSIKLKATI
jgi:hypothetical protein